MSSHNISSVSTGNKEIHPVRSRIKVDDLNIQSIISNQGITLNIDHEVDKDEAMILALGYKQEFNREFSLWSVFAVSFSVLGLLPSIAATFDYQQLVIGISPVPWLIGGLLVASVAFSMAEVASAFPTSAGTPYAVSQLSPPKYSAFLTWITCFTNWFCQITASPSVNYSGACLILALASFNSSSGYVPTTGQIYGLTTGIQITHAILSSCPTKFLARFNTVGTSVNMIFLLIVFVIILAGNDRVSLSESPIPKFNDNSTAWGLTNLTEFPQGISFLMSFLGVIWAMSGYDSPFHLAEETESANVAAPKAIVFTATIGGMIGWIFMIAIAYTVVDLDQIMEDPQGLGQPFVTYLTQVLNKKLVNTATSLTVVSSYFMGASCMLAASRVTYAYSRDNLFPFSKYWKIVNPLTKTPINAVWVNFIIGQLLLLLMFAGDTAIGAIFSVGGISGFVSFTMPTLLKITYANSTFKPGPWNLGRFSRPIGFVSVAFVTLMIPILCFPTVKGADLTPDMMNWTVLVYFGPLLLVTIWYVLDAHKWYVGPKSNLEEYEISYGDEVEGSSDTDPEKKVTVIDGVSTPGKLSSDNKV